MSFVYWLASREGDMVGANLFFQLLLPFLYVMAITKLKKERKTAWKIVKNYCILEMLHLLADMVLSELAKGASDEMLSYLLFLIPPVATGVLSVVIVRDYSVQSRVVVVSLVGVTWLLAPSVSFLIPFSENMAINTIFPRVIIYVVLIYIVHRYNFDETIELNRWAIAIFEVICVLCAAMQVVTQLNPGLYMHLAALVFMGWVVCVLTYVFLIMLDKVNAERMMAHLEKNRLQNTMAQLNMAQANYEAMRVIRHDIKNQYAYLQSLIEGGKIEQANTFFEEASKKVNEVLDYINIENRTVNAVCNMEKNKARTQGIKIIVNGNVPEGLAIDENDLFAILVNLLDNAIEAVLLSKKTNIPITAEIYLMDYYLHIMISNPYNEKTSGMNVIARHGTSKADMPRHGVGNLIIRNIVNKHEGAINYEEKEGMFTVNVMLVAVST